MASGIVYASGGDGYIQSYSMWDNAAQAWSNARSGGSYITAVNYSDQWASLNYSVGYQTGGDKGATWTDYWANIARIYFVFNAQYYGGASISSCNLNWYDSTGSNQTFYAVPSTQASGSLSTSDWGAITLTDCGSDSATTDSWFDITLTTAGLNHLRTSASGDTLNGIVKFAILGTADFNNNGATGHGSRSVYFSESSNKPQLVINYTATAPVVASGSVSNISSSGATYSCKVLGGGGSGITERGVVWATGQNPTTSNGKGTSTGTLGAYTANATGLSAETTYYIRGYATNSVGTTYGTQTSFTTTSAVTYYGILKRYNGSIWVKEPLKYWTGSTWTSGKPLKRWDGSQWRTIDTTGV